MEFNGNDAGRPNMPTLIVEDVPSEVYELLRKRAKAEQRTLSEELLHLLKHILRGTGSPPPRLPDLIPNEEMAAPCDLPRTSQPVEVLSPDFSHLIANIWRSTLP